jgi:hypothetical protein
MNGWGAPTPRPRGAPARALWATWWRKVCRFQTARDISAPWPATGAGPGPFGSTCSGLYNRDTHVFRPRGGVASSRRACKQRTRDSSAHRHATGPGPGPFGSACGGVYNRDMHVVRPRGRHVAYRETRVGGHFRGRRPSFPIKPCGPGPIASTWPGKDDRDGHVAWRRHWKQPRGSAHAPSPARSRPSRRPRIARPTPRVGAIRLALASCNVSARWDGSGGCGAGSRIFSALHRAYLDTHTFVRGRMATVGMPRTRRIDRAQVDVGQKWILTRFWDARGDSRGAWAASCMDVGGSMSKCVGWRSNRGRRVACDVFSGHV